VTLLNEAIKAPRHDEEFKNRKVNAKENHKKKQKKNVKSVKLNKRKKIVQKKNKKVKNDSMVNYQITGDKSALAALLWGENVSEFGETLLLDSKTLGIYDFSKYKSAYIESNFQE